MPGILAATVEDALITLVILLLSIVSIKLYYDLACDQILLFWFCSYAAICNQPLQGQTIYSQVYMVMKLTISKFPPEKLLSDLTLTTCQ